MSVITERIQIGKYRVALKITRIFDTDMIWIGIHGHDLFLDICFRLGEIDAVAE